jgi:hypothetical protein
MYVCLSRDLGDFIIDYIIANIRWGFMLVVIFAHFREYSLLAICYFRRI